MIDKDAIHKSGVERLKDLYEWVVVKDVGTKNGFTIALTTVFDRIVDEEQWIVLYCEDDPRTQRSIKKKDLRNYPIAVAPGPDRLAQEEFIKTKFPRFKIHRLKYPPRGQGSLFIMLPSTAPEIVVQQKIWKEPE